MQRETKVAIFQGGGPTPVINMTLAMMVLELLRLGVRHIYGARRGVRGVVTWDVVDLGRQSRQVLINVGTTPGAELKSARDKYSDDILQMLIKQRVTHFIGIGGNDTADTVMKTGQAAQNAGYPLICVHAAKTVDNDLCCSYVTPGFPSAAWYVARRFTRLDIDTSGMSRVHFALTMGRHSGFLTAAAAFAPTDIILIPERPVVLTDLFARIDDAFIRRDKCLIAVSEGIVDPSGALMFDVAGGHKEDDPHGNRKLTSGALLVEWLCRKVTEELKLECRGETLGYAPRAGDPSPYDHDIAAQVGVRAAQLAVTDGRNGSVGIVSRVGELCCNVAPLTEVAGKDKFRTMPDDFIARNGMHVTEAYLDYVKPMIGKLPVVYHFE